MIFALLRPAVVLPCNLWIWIISGGGGAFLGVFVLRYNHEFLYFLKNKMNQNNSSQRNSYDVGKYD